MMLVDLPPELIHKVISHLVGIPSLGHDESRRHFRFLVRLGCTCHRMRELCIRYTAETTRSRTISVPSDEQTLTGARCYLLQMPTLNLRLDKHLRTIFPGLSPLLADGVCTSLRLTCCSTSFRGLANENANYSFNLQRLDIQLPEYGRVAHADGLLQLVRSCPKLRALRIQSFVPCNMTCQAVQDCLTVASESCPSLSSLELSTWGHRLDGFAYIPKMPRIINLTLRVHKDVAFAFGLGDVLWRLPALRSLELIGWVPQAELPDDVSCPLQQVSMYECGTSTALKYLCAFRSVSRIGMDSKDEEVLREILHETSERAPGQLQEVALITYDPGSYGREGNRLPERLSAEFRGIVFVEAVGRSGFLNRSLKPIRGFRDGKEVCIDDIQWE